ncbi:MAG TPA: M20/M25/M40 family metallo-hydrolase [Bryobacteraceae bacterium]|nr:M20/M25/M40 family metallo-hydrolase [Bryobacteraceae bacterium]
MKVFHSALAVAVLCTAGSFAYSQETVDLSVIHRIKAEAFENSQVMDHIFYLTDVHGPRLTGSPGYKEAGDWVISRLKEYGLVNVNEEAWGPFGRGWTYTRFAGHMMAPQYQPLIGAPLAWTPGTNGAVQGNAIYAPIATEADFEKFKGKLQGKIILTMPLKTINMITEAPAHRLTDAELEARANMTDPARLAGLASGLFAGPGGPGAQPSPEERERRTQFRRKMNQFLKDEGALLVLQYGNSGDGGTVFVQGGGSQNPKEPIPPSMLAVTPEHYNRVVRLLQHHIPVKLEFEIQARFIDSPTDSFNVVAEIPGGSKKDELVMLGAHLDSWHSGTGATDNATGSSVAIEAVRILKALNLKMDRTVRIALWGGEEEGLLGSQAYVKQHFADRETMEPKPEFFKLAAYFNDDTGTGRFRGISAQSNDQVKPIFETWLKPFHDLGATTVGGATGRSAGRPGGTDHTSFDYVGLPGFNFIQDPMEYSTRTHHSNMDVYDRVQPGDVMQCAAIMAAFVYNAATRPEMLPRIPMPKPIPRERDRRNSTQ